MQWKASFACLRTFSSICGYLCCHPNFVISPFSSKHEELRVVRFKVPLVLESQGYMKVRDRNRDTSKASLCTRAFTYASSRTRVQESVVRMTVEECTSDAIVIARSRVFRKDAYSVFLYVTSTLPSRGALPFWFFPCGTSRKFMDYSQRTRENGGRAGGEKAGSINRCS